MGSLGVLATASTKRILSSGFSELASMANGKARNKLLFQ
jgi:hypothetical protein